MSDRLVTALGVVGIIAILFIGAFFTHLSAEQAKRSNPAVHWQCYNSTTKTYTFLTDEQYKNKPFYLAICNHI